MKIKYLTSRNHIRITFLELDFIDIDKIILEDKIYTQWTIDHLSLSTMKQVQKTLNHLLSESPKNKFPAINARNRNANNDSHSNTSHTLTNPSDSDSDPSNPSDPDAATFLLFRKKFLPYTIIGGVSFAIALLYVS